MAQHNAIWLPDALASERPASPGKGRYLYRATDTGAVSYWDGSAWRTVYDPTATVSATQLQGRSVASDAPTNGQALVWDAGQSRWEPGTIATGGASTETYAFGGGTHDYTADSAYNPAGATSTVRAETGLLGDGTNAPRFWVFGRDYTAALAITSVPSLRITLTNTNGAPLLRVDSTSQSGANVLVHLPWWAQLLPAWTLDAVVATNIAGTLCTGGSDFATCRVGLVSQNAPTDGIPRTVCFNDIYSYAGDGGGAMREGRGMDGNADTASDISGETSGGVNVRAVRIVRSGAMLTLSTGPNAGALTERRKYINSKLRTAGVAWSFVLAMGQVKATPTVGYYGELRSLVFTPG